MADAYTTVNLQAGYRINRCQLRLFLNNIFDSVGYTAYYRGGYLNPTDPRNVAVAMTWQF
jgi:iron complex outermembrane receptor protein